MCKAMNVMCMSLITTLHLSHGHVVVTILHSLAAVRVFEGMAGPLALPPPARVPVGPRAVLNAKNNVLGHGFFKNDRV